MSGRRLSGKAALITGASRGIGKGIASSFAREGASVFLCARGEEALRRTAREIESSASGGGEVAYRVADVSDPEDAERLIARAVERFPRLGILVNNASILGKRAPIIELDVATWDEVLRVNTSSLFYVTRPLLPHLLSLGEGSIVNVSSSVGRKGKPQWGAYAVSKFGLEGFTQVLAAELETSRIRVNSVNPGPTRTEMRAEAYPQEDPESLPSPEEISEVFVYLASDESRAITGQSFEARDFMNANR